LKNNSGKKKQEMKKEIGKQKDLFLTVAKMHEAYEK
jgi:hypothetical protein